MIHEDHSGCQTTARYDSKTMACRAAGLCGIVKRSSHWRMKPPVAPGARHNRFDNSERAVPQTAASRFARNRFHLSCLDRRAAAQEMHIQSPLSGFHPVRMSTGEATMLNLLRFAARTTAVSCMFLFAATTSEPASGQVVVPPNSNGYYPGNYWNGYGVYRPYY